MRVPISWLRDYVDIELNPAELDELITCAGLEVTSVERFGVEGAELEWNRDKVLLARILEVEPVPDADRLVLVAVDDGSGTPRKVVTGAPNLFPFKGQGPIDGELYGALLLEGGRYHNPYKDGKITVLKGKELRGIKSDAMLCSPVELGLGEDHDGVIVIDAADAGPLELTPGTPLQDVLGDVVLEIDIIPNVARCASMVGVAREVAALTGKELREPSYDVTAEGPSVAGRVVIETDAPELNPRFVALLIEGVEQKPAPFWMQHRLRLAGQRPINVVVDVSNYVMLEVGQPNHTFDFDFLRRRADEYDPQGPVRIQTRLAQPDEKLTTLDGEEHELRANNILVTDPMGNLSLGGIMGGLESEIQPGTTNVLLEAAAWNFINIRHTGRQLGINTEAGFRFSRGVHPEQAMRGARRAAELLRLHAGGTIARDIVDYYPQPPEVSKIRLERPYLHRQSGLDLELEDACGLLRRLGFSASVDGDAIVATAPDHRIDVEGPHDLVEEICRMYGYDRVPSTVLADSLPPQRGNVALEKEERIRDLLVDQGSHELITYRLTTREAEDRLLGSDRTAEYVTLANPATADRVVMRHSLLASVLEVVEANSRFQPGIAVFELGPVFPKPTDSAIPDELPYLAIVLTGQKTDAHWHSEHAIWQYDFFDLKGRLESLFDALHVEVDFVAAEHDAYSPGRTAALRAGGEQIGVCGVLHPAVAARYDFRFGADQAILAAEIDLSVLLPQIPDSYSVEALPIYPATREDLALIVDADVEAAEIESALLAAGRPLLRAVELFDVYEGETVGDGKKSLAYHLTLQAPNRTLKEKDAAKIRRKILSELERKTGATLRSA